MGIGVQKSAAGEQMKGRRGHVHAVLGHKAKEKGQRPSCLLQQVEWPGCGGFTARSSAQHNGLVRAFPKSELGFFAASVP